SGGYGDRQPGGGHRAGAGHLSGHRRGPRRPHLGGRRPGGTRQHLPLHAGALGGPMSRRTTVLLVEDDPDLLHGVRLTLRVGHYRVVTASDGEAALSLAQRARPDLVLLDLRLPRLDGWQVMAALQAMPG